MAIAQSIERKSNDRSILPVLQSPERSFYPAKLDSQIIPLEISSSDDAFCALCL